MTEIRIRREPDGGLDPVGDSNAFPVRVVEWKAGSSFADYLQYLSFIGRCFVASSGTETTPITAAAYDQDQPAFTLGVPNGTVIIPFRLEFMLESFAGTDNEAIAWMTDNAIPAGTSAAATEGPNNMRSDAPLRFSSCTARQLHTANVTLTAYRELWRVGQPLADTNPGAFVWEPRPAPVLVGPASLGLALAATTTQPTYYLKVYWAELSNSWLKDYSL